MSQENGNGSGAEDGQQEEKQQRSLDSVLAESNRKFDKLAQENAKLSQQLEQIMSAIKPKQAASSQSGNEDSELENLMYSDPKAYSKKISEKATREATQYVQQQLNQQQQTNAVLSQMVTDYPELSDINSEISKKAVELFKQLPENERTSTTAYKAVIREAAAELGMLPKTKRKQSDDFTMSGGSGGQQASSKSKDLDAATLAFAQAVGMDVKDKKVVERLKQRANRKNWNKYE